MYLDGWGNTVYDFGTVWGVLLRTFPLEGVTDGGVYVIGEGMFGTQEGKRG